LSRTFAASAVILAVALFVPQASAQTPSYAQLYNPLHVLNLNFEMVPADWAAVQADQTLDLEKPAWFWADGESKMLVSVRRKSLSADSDKISLKIDVNEYFDQNVWHGVKKLSFENGFDADVVSEGLAWHLHRRAETLPGDNYQPGHAAWVNVALNGAPLGVYASVEQVDKRFLRNRDLWTDGETWLYKKSDIGQQTLEEGPSPNSPTVTALNYSPFTSTNTPPPAGYEAQLETLIDMKGMLTLGAVNAFTTNGDELFTKGKNFWFADFDGGKRMHSPWDLDAVFKGTGESIYGSNSPYTTYILNNPNFRDDYNQIMLELLAGPLSVASLHDFLDDLEPVLTLWLEADPNSNIDDVAGHFDDLRQWVALRHANVLGQVQGDMAASGASAGVPEPGGLTCAGVALGWVVCRRRRRGA
jgi:spore coat protein CotH